MSLRSFKLSNLPTLGRRGLAGLLWGVQVLATVSAPADSIDYQLQGAMQVGNQVWLTVLDTRSNRYLSVSNESKQGRFHALEYNPEEGYALMLVDGKEVRLIIANEEHSKSPTTNTENASGPHFIELVDGSVEANRKIFEMAREDVRSVSKRRRVPQDPTNSPETGRSTIAAQQPSIQAGKVSENLAAPISEEERATLQATLAYDSEAAKGRGRKRSGGHITVDNVFIDPNRETEATQ